MQTPYTWHDGTVTFEPGHSPANLDTAKVCLDVPGWLLYSLAERMTYAVPLSKVTEVTIDDLDWRGKHAPLPAG